MGKAIFAVIAVAFTSIVAALAQTEINVTILHSAVQKGAVCLDGSPPGYYYAEGSGSGSNNWIIYLQGGGWCSSVEVCQNRTHSYVGSSLYFLPNITFSGMLDLDSSYNPNFYNWHKVFIGYCDGASFMADVEHPVNGLRFRGARIFKVIVEEMMSRGMKDAHNAILTGTSAGGLATTLHCDSFQALFPFTTRVKCISDSGFFIHAEDLRGAFSRTLYFDHVIALHEINKSLPISCTSKMDTSLCLYPENFAGAIKTPLFLLDSAFDLDQVQNNLVPYYGGLSWTDCISNVTSCNSSELEILRDFRAAFIEMLLKLDHSPSRGMFIHSFYRHGHILLRNGWTCSSVYGNNVLANMTIGQAVSDWYFDRSPFAMIDTEHDIPRYSAPRDLDSYDHKCVVTMSSESIACNHFVNIGYILAMMYITLMLY